MNLLPFSRKSMRVQDLKQQTAIRLAQEQQQRRNSEDVYENNNSGQQQQPQQQALWNSNNAYLQQGPSYRRSNPSNNTYDYNSQHVGYHQHRSANNNNTAYSQHVENNSSNIDDYQRRGLDNGGFFPVESYGPPNTDLHHVEAVNITTPPSTPRNRRHHSSKSSKSSSNNNNREGAKREFSKGSAVPSNNTGMTTPTGVSRTSSSTDDNVTNKLKNNKSAYYKLMNRKKDQRRNNNNNSNANDSNGAKPPPQSPMEVHQGKQFPRQQHAASPHNLGGPQSYNNNSQHYNYQHMQHSGTQVLNSPRRNHHLHHHHHRQQQRFIATPNSTNSSSSKLPHGLTVQELKEMTRARLAAEAFEGQCAPNDEIQKQQQHQQHSGDTQNFSPAALLFHTESSLRTNPRFSHHHVAERQRLHSSDSTPSANFVLRQRLNSAETAASAPATTKYQSSKQEFHNHHCQGGMVRNNSHHSLSDYQLHSKYNSNNLQDSDQYSQTNNFGGAMPTDTVSQSFNDSIDYGHYYNGTPSKNYFYSRHNNNNQDVFETGSVNSFNSELGPEYLASSDYPVGYPKGCTPQQQQQQQQHYAICTDEDSRYAFGRSRSYPSGTSLGNAIENAGDASAFSPCHNNNNNRNRCRAATASPPGLSHVLEDRPIVDGGISGNFSTSSLDMTSQSPRSIPLVEPNAGSTHIQGNNMNEPNSNSSSPLSSRFSTCNFIPDGARWYDIFGRPSSSKTVAIIEPSSEDLCTKEDEKLQQQKETTLPISSSCLGASNHSTSNGSEFLPNSVAESVLGTTFDNGSLKYSNGNSTISNRDSDGVIGASGVFRNVISMPSPNHQKSSISRNGTFDSGIIGQGRLPTRVSGVNSWCDDYQTVDKSNLGITNESQNIANSVSMLRLEDDLNSLLNIAAEENVDLKSKYHHFFPSLVSKIDPELDVSTPQPSLVANSTSSVSASIAGDASFSFLKYDNASSNEDPSVCSNVCLPTSVDQFQNNPPSIEPKRSSSPQRKSNSWAFDLRRRNVN